MELLELLMIGPVAYLIIRGFIKLWNEDVEAKYNKAQNLAELLMGEGKHYEAKRLMEAALIDYKRSIIRKVFGIKL